MTPCCPGKSVERWRHLVAVSFINKRYRVGLTNTFFFSPKELILLRFSFKNPYLVLMWGNSAITPV